MNLVELEMCMSCRKVDVKEQLVKTYCEITDTHGYDHEECLRRDWEMFHSASED